MQIPKPSIRSTWQGHLEDYPAALGFRSNSVRGFPLVAKGLAACILREQSPEITARPAAAMDSQKPARVPHT